MLSRNCFVPIPLLVLSNSVSSSLLPEMVRITFIGGFRFHMVTLILQTNIFLT